MCSYRGGEGGSQETYSVRLKKVSEIYGRPLKLHITSIQVPMPAVQFVGFVVLNNSTALRSLATDYSTGRNQFTSDGNALVYTVTQVYVTHGRWYKVHELYSEPRQVSLQHT